MVDKKGEKVEIGAEDVGSLEEVLGPEPEVELKVDTPKIVLTPEQLASRQLAHDIKVAKFLAGGEF